MSDLITRARKHWKAYGHPVIIVELIKALERSQTEVKRLQDFEKFVFSDNNTIKAFTGWKILRALALAKRDKARQCRGYFQQSESAGS